MNNLYLHNIRESSTQRFTDLRADLQSTPEINAEVCCVYATGSFGRLEAGPLSDLDLFIITDTKETEKNREQRLLDGLNEVILKYHLISLTKNHSIPPFDGQGKYLAVHELKSYTKWLGSPEDDSRNTLTGRMLMLLESRPLVGDGLYDRCIELVIDAYFKDYSAHPSNFSPAFLFNDILRMWRTFCVNYEFHRKEGSPRNKIKNLKLKFSRMLTCYSAVIFLLDVYGRQNTIHPNDVRRMISLSPTQRLEALGDESVSTDSNYDEEIALLSQKALEVYSEFLELTHKPLSDSISIFESDEAIWRAKSYSFGNHLSKIISRITEASGTDDGLARIIII